MSSLFSEITIKNIKIKNRIVMPPMVCFGWAGDDGIVTEKHLKHYEARAKGGVGLIIVEATCIRKNGRNTNSQLGIWSDEHISGLKAIAERCHKYEAKVLVQINHGGFKTHKSVSEDIVAPSDYNDGTFSARMMTIEELHEIQNDYAKAAIKVKQAGMDGVELHGAHGFLISQFMSPVTNKRTDEYGGSIDNRMRFAAEIIEKVKGEVGNDFIIEYRMGGNEPSLENGITIAKRLESLGIDILHVSAGISDGSVPQVPEGFQYNWIVYSGTEIKKHVSIPVIVVNDIRTPERAAYLVENDMADFTAMGKGLLVDPEWAKKAKEGMNVTTCLKCSRCLWFTNGESCPRYAK